MADIAAGKLAGGQRGGDTFVGETRWRTGQLGVDSLAAEPDIKKASNALFRATQMKFELDDLQEGFDALDAACANNGYTTTTILGPNMDPATRRNDSWPSLRSSGPGGPPPDPDRFDRPTSCSSGTTG